MRSLSRPRVLRLELKLLSTQGMECDVEELIETKVGNGVGVHIRLMATPGMHIMMHHVPPCTILFLFFFSVDTQFKKKGKIPVRCLFVNEH